MPLQDVINVVATIGQSPIGLAAFNVPLVFALLTAPQQAAWGSDVVREVTPSNWRTVLTSAGVATNEDLYRALAIAFQQDLRPNRILVASRQTAVAQVVTVTIPGVPTDGPYVVTIDGTDITFTASSSTQTQVRDGLIAAIDSGVGTLVDAAIGSASTLTITALAAGRPFVVSVDSPADSMTMATTTPSTGLPEDLEDALAERTDFYFVMEVGHDVDDLYALSGAVESQDAPMLYIAQTDDAVAQTAGTTDVGNQLRLLAYARTAVIWHDDDDEFADAMVLGQLASSTPGSITWANKQGSGVVGIVPTDTTQLTTKNYTWLEYYPSKSLSATRRARVADGTPIDLIIAVDFARDLYQSRLFGLELSAPKLPYTAKGRQMIEGTIDAATELLASDEYKIADPEFVEVFIPEPRDQSTEDQADRHYPGIVVSLVAQGAAETIAMTLTIAQAA